MNKIPFFKMSGSGNDFIIIDNRLNIINTKDIPALAAKLCKRGISLGADGLIFIENSETQDFKWQFFNADGSSAEMCGNGGRCAARFAFIKGIAAAKLSFETLAGVIRAEVLEKSVRIQLTPPSRPDMDITLEVNSKIHKLKRCSSFIRKP